MPGSVISSTSAVEVIIHAVSAALIVDCATSPGRVRDKEGTAPAATSGAVCASAPPHRPRHSDATPPNRWLPPRMAAPFRKLLQARLHEPCQPQHPDSAPGNPITAPQRGRETPNAPAECSRYSCGTRKRASVCQARGPRRHSFYQLTHFKHPTRCFFYQALAIPAPFSCLFYAGLPFANAPGSPESVAGKLRKSSDATDFYYLRLAARAAAAGAAGGAGLHAGQERVGAAPHSPLCGQGRSAGGVPDRRGHRLLLRLFWPGHRPVLRFFFCW